jgi:hypothetical protein
MHHLKLFCAAAALFWSSSAMLRAESIMASNTGDVSLPASSSTLAAAPSSSTVPTVTAAPPVAAALPTTTVAARSDVGDQPQQKVTDPASAADHHHPAVMGGRPAAPHARLRHFCAHPPVRAHTHAAARTAPPPAPVWLAAPSMPPCSHCWQLVLLGVGY